jgi:hypothetical protein
MLEREEVTETPRLRHLRAACPQGLVIGGDSMGRQLFLRLAALLRSSVADTAAAVRTIAAGPSVEHYFLKSAALNFEASTVSADGRNVTYDTTLAVGSAVRTLNQPQDGGAWRVGFEWDESDPTIAVDPASGDGVPMDGASASDLQHQAHLRSGQRQCRVRVLGYHFLYAKRRVECDEAAVRGYFAGVSAVVLPPASIGSVHELAGMNALIAERDRCIARLLGAGRRLAASSPGGRAPHRGRVLVLDDASSRRCDGMHFSCQLGPRLESSAVEGAQSLGATQCTSDMVRFRRDDAACECTDVANLHAAVGVIDKLAADAGVHRRG